MRIFLYYPSGNYVVAREYDTYDLSSFIGDVGGYLGLCLGMSILSFYDAALIVANKILRFVMVKLNSSIITKCA
jgi:hypothetical protein